MRNFLKIVRWTFYAIVFISAAGGVTGMLLYLHASEELPRLSSLNDYCPPVVTTVYSDNNRKIAEFYREHRILISLPQMPKMLIDAFVAAEDSRFFTHRGVDYIGILRAFFKNIEAGSIVQGGSTITQQVVKPFLLIHEKKKSYKRKLKEAILAYRIEKNFTKEEILYLYLNEIYLGSGAYGVEAAALTYFGKSAKELNLAECTMLAGLPKAPSGYSPYRNPEKTKERQRYVLRRMFEKGYISEKQMTEALDTELKLRTKRKNWYLENVPYFTEHVRQYVEEKYGKDALYEGGLQIYTTVDTDMQKTARAAILKGLESISIRHKYQKRVRPQAALVCIEPGTGYVRALVGGRRFRESSFNRATQARRQPGSSFKPVIYAAALDKGYTPATILMDSDATFWDKNAKKHWRPHNYDRKYYGRLSLRKALAKSRNIPAVKVLRDIGIKYTINYARKLGITSDLINGLSLALGPSGVSLLELTTAYSVFANLGDLVHPIFIKKITDRYGNDISEMKAETQRAVDRGTAYVMTSLLEGVVQNGTGRAVRALGCPVAGKTGTSNDMRDAWFLGYTPDYITGTWVGFDKERSLGKKETGSRAASPIWLDFMKKVQKGKPVRKFEVPNDVVFAHSEYFKKGTVPIYRSDETESSKQYEPPPATVADKPRRKRRYKPRRRDTIVGMDQFFKSTM